MNAELIPVLSLLAAVAGGIFGAWVGVKVALVRLETQMEEARKSLEIARSRLHRHNDTILIHDMEIEMALDKLEIPRIRRQAVQE